jgi:hypothetical protein
MKGSGRVAYLRYHPGICLAGLKIPTRNLSG